MTRDSRWIIPAAMLLMVQHGSAIIISRLINFTERPPTFSYMVVALVLSLAGGLVIFLRRLFVIWSEGEPRPTKRILNETDYGAVATYLLGFQLVGLQMAALTWLKEMIPFVAPFWADPMLALLERSILTIDAWRLVPEALVRPLDAVYPTWAPIKFLALLLMLCLPASTLKARAMLAYFLTLGLMGVTGQYLFSSVGPIFYDRIVGGDDFAPLTVRIHEHAPVASLASSYLWNSFVMRQPGIGAGISAMPSIHVATTTWMALALSTAWPKSRAPAWVFWVVIFVGSFALGWHYVLDSVVGTVGAVACWKLAAWYLQSTAKLSQPAAVTAAD
jgi:hypothetical protein